MSAASRPETGPRAGCCNISPTTSRRAGLAACPAHASGDGRAAVVIALRRVAGFGALPEEAFRRDKSLVVTGEHGDVFVNVFNPKIRLVIAARTDIAQLLASIARALGYDVVIIDPRQAFATEERFGAVKLVREWPDEASPKIGVDARTALIGPPTIQARRSVPDRRASIGGVLCRGAWQQDARIRAGSSA